MATNPPIADTASAAPAAAPAAAVVTTTITAAATPAAATAPATATAELIICGHPAPYLLQSCGEVRLLDSEEPAPPLGMRLLAFGPQAVASLTVALRPGESLVCYTDGITESRDRSGEFFPLADVLSAVLADSASDKRPKGIADAVRTHLAAHTRGTMHDDAAVLILRRSDD